MKRIPPPPLLPAIVLSIVFLIYINFSKIFRKWELLTLARMAHLEHPYFATKRTLCKKKKNFYIV